MIPEGNLKNNIERFSGYEDVYDKYRPQAPQALVQVLTNYAGGKPSLVMDIGCGTGLSSFVWKDDAQKIIGVEPNADMIGKARDNLHRIGASHISFVQGYSNQLDAASGSVDVITCSQSFHWMEPESTLREVARVLREGGVFAAYDCDWPPTIHWSIEEAYERLVSKADVIIARLAQEEDRALKRDKGKHLSNLKNSGAFRYCKEILFHNIERFDAERYVGLALSQGGVQTVFKLGSSELDEDIETFRTRVAQYFSGKSLDVLFSYRMRVGVK
ncbi:class I SAM-dependent methyltransferase [Paenibacillus allorhizosphaerae]|uniref:2-methoxy-6-polyprenyl-1,4-benzoquinol methylase, mitochondrial n=1 Tax=Paenibacillus allorhizosphaerae TaxID=2849866 RepID=A0ABN7TS90_9BACL|nr:class I SAM-dependent methyltransferase [Paenibacillus allorhizosphaerae]CAG7653871.1 2-methoxy-6-polyprenyl-1,4-benzoquinol methylase, mitochondrial [Paenibacillus allorhizosphaerae]